MHNVCNPIVVCVSYLLRGNRSEAARSEARANARLALLIALGELQNLDRGDIVRVKDGGYQIVTGERRWRAAKKAGLKSVPVIVKDVTDSDMLELALIENLQREDLNPLEEARAFLRLMDEFGLAQEEVGKAVGKDADAGKAARIDPTKGLQ